MLHSLSNEARHVPWSLPDFQMSSKKLDQCFPLTKVDDIADSAKHAFSSPSQSGRHGEVTLAEFNYTLPRIKVTEN